MDIYRHYKGKLYRMLAKVLHSESLESLVLYETLYPNDKGKLWVRPEAMFFETIVEGGKQLRRFEKLALNAHLIDQVEDLKSLSQAQLDLLLKHTRRTRDELMDDLTRKAGFRLLFADLQEELCGFILGFESGSGSFQCQAWGKTEAKCGQEALSFLERKLVLLCREAAYKHIHLSLDADHRDEICLALQAGYSISGTEQRNGRPLQVRLERSLQ